MAMKTYRKRLDRIAASLAETSQAVTLSPEKEAELEYLQQRKGELDLRQSSRRFFLMFEKYPFLRKISPVGLADRIKARTNLIDSSK